MSRAEKVFNCFDCGQQVYFNREIKRPDDHTKMARLAEPITLQEMSQGKIPVFHECDKSIKKQGYDYQDMDTRLKQRNQAKKESGSNLLEIDKGELKSLREEVHYLRELMEVIVKSLDRVLSDKGEEGTLFTKASKLHGDVSQPIQGTETKKEENGEITGERGAIEMEDTTELPYQKDSYSY